MAESIIQTDGIKRCYLSGQRCGKNGEPLEKHHVMNGSLRDWADAEGLWIWLAPEYHRFLHSTGTGVMVQKKLLKQIAQFAYMKEHTEREWMDKVHKNYVG